jgi:hypothetical protein
VQESRYDRIRSSAATLAPPATPTGLVANVESGTRINLIWTDWSGNETGFRIRRRTTTRGSWTVIGTAGPNTTSYINSGLNPGQTYYDVVTAFSSVRGVTLFQSGQCHNCEYGTPSGPYNTDCYCHLRYPG